MRCSLKDYPRPESLSRSRRRRLVDVDLSDDYMKGFRKQPWPSRIPEGITWEGARWVIKEPLTLLEQPVLGAISGLKWTLGAQTFPISASASFLRQPSRALSWLEPIPLYLIGSNSNATSISLRIYSSILRKSSNIFSFADRSPIFPNYLRNILIYGTGNTDKDCANHSDRQWRNNCSLTSSSALTLCWKKKHSRNTSRFCPS